MKSLNFNHFKWLLVPLVFFTIGVSHMWAATATFTPTSYSGSSSPYTVNGTLSGAPAGAAASCTNTYNNANQMTSGNSMTLTLTGFDGCTITGLSCDAGSNTGGQKKGKGTISISINGSNKGSLTLNRPGAHSSKTVSVTSTIVAEDGTIVVTISATESSLYCYSYTITYTAPAAPTTTVSASPSSITFDAAVLDPVDGAEGSKTTTISLTNGNVGYPGGVSCYLNGWTETDETDCEFYVNSDYTYQYTSSTTSQTVTLSYYATDAGTFEGNFIIQGFNSSHVAVNCTIPLSVTVSAPACANTVTVGTGASTNGSIK